MLASTSKTGPQPPLFCPLPLDETDDDGAGDSNESSSSSFSFGCASKNAALGAMAAPPMETLPSPSLSIRMTSLSESIIVAVMLYSFTSSAAITIRFLLSNESAVFSFS